MTNREKLIDKIPDLNAKKQAEKEKLLSAQEKKVDDLLEKILGVIPEFQNNKRAVIINDSAIEFTEDEKLKAIFYKKGWHFQVLNQNKFKDIEENTIKFSIEFILSETK